MSARIYRWLARRIRMLLPRLFQGRRGSLLERYRETGGGC